VSELNAKDLVRNFSDLMMGVKPPGQLEGSES